MRNITVNPITVEEVREYLGRQREKIGDDTIIGGTDGLIAAYLINYFEAKRVQDDLHRFLEEVQPKLEVSGLDALSKKDLEALWRGAYSTSGVRLHKDHSIWGDIEYRGVSKRGSHVYDVNVGYNSQARIYVRIVDGKLRGEVHEDNFKVMIPCPPVIEHRPDGREDKLDEPVSWVGQLWRDWTNRKWE